MSDLGILQERISSLSSDLKDQKEEIDLLRHSVQCARVELETIKSVLDIIKKLVFSALVPSLLSLVVTLIGHFLK